MTSDWPKGLDELLIIVDDQDREIGSLDKRSCHVGEGILHRAFSVFIFTRKGELMLQRRSNKKPLWPLYWSNSCCSHPRPYESIDKAAHRRIQEELGLSCSLEYLYKFKYHAPFEDLGSEREFCSVFYGYYDGDVNPDSNEISDLCFISPEKLSLDIQENLDKYTPWFIMEWEKIAKLYLSNILLGCNRI